MGKVIDVQEVQDELNRAARDARHGPADVRAGKFVHATRNRASAAASPRASSPKPPRKSKPVR